MMPNKADATRLRLLVAIKSRALNLVRASGASVVDVLLMLIDLIVLQESPILVNDAGG